MGVDLLIVAGEHSGDNHAASWVQALKKRHPQLSICAIGGPALRQAGAHLLFDLTHWSAVGLIEVIRRYPSFMRLLHWTVEWVRAYQPKIICLVDFPGFNLKLAKRLCQEKLTYPHGGTTRIFGYISPQIWAWNTRRRFKIERYFNHLGTIFPFEPTCFADTSLDVRFVGHPLLNQPNPFRYDPNGPLLLLPGSRLGAVKQITPILKAAVHELRKHYPQLHAIIPYPNQAIQRYLSVQELTGIDLCPLATFNTGVCSAIMSSGTASLQVALAGIPGVITYRANPITFFIGKRLAKVRYLSMANILLHKPLYPEVLQDTPNQALTVAHQMESFLSQTEQSRTSFLEGADALKQLLSSHSVQTLVDWLESLLLTSTEAMALDAELKNSNPKA
ncbi:MAG TPA: lipid-A-disaccharide synthase [Opitutae bacterium]|nr:lipid-A-disaccharide synthase [Opitutae bacterium]